MSNRSLEDQATAMSEGYASTTDWAVAKLIRMVQELKERVDKLEGVETLKREGFLLEHDDAG